MLIHRNLSNHAIPAVVVALLFVLPRCGGSSSPPNGADAPAPGDLDADVPHDAAAHDAGSHEAGPGSPTDDAGDTNGPDAATDAPSAIDAAAPSDYNAVWGFAPNDVWLGDQLGVMTHWDGTRFQTFTVGTLPSVKSLWGAATGDVWAAADYSMLHWDGAHLTAVQVPTQALFVSAVYGSGAKDVWAVGQSGVAVHWDGKTWTSFSGASDDLEAVYVRSPTEAYAVGGFLSPVMIKWNGIEWASFTTTGLAGGLDAVWASAPNDVWVGSSSGGVAHYDGGQWTQAAEPLANQPIRQVWGTGPGDVWAVGGFAGSGAAFHYDGAHWSSVDPGNVDTLRGVWSTSGAGNTWFVGDSGAIVRR